MKELIFTIFLLVNLSSVASKTSEEFIQDFISSSITAVTFISVDEASSNSSSVINKFHSIPKTILHLNSSALKNCSNYANVDFYGRNITAKKFQSDFMLDEILYLNEFSDFLIFTPSKFIALMLKCIVQPRSRYLIQVTTTTTLEPLSITHMLNETWNSNGALKIFILQQDKVISFNPFHRNDDGSYGKLNSFVASFKSSEWRFKNLNGYPLRVELFPSTFTMARIKGFYKTVDDFDGPDADVAKIMKAQLNATMPIYKNDGTKFGFKHPNGTFTGALNSLSQRKSHAAFVTFFVKDYETRNIEFSASVYSDDLCLIVKKAERIPTFMLPLITFDRSLWIALGVFCVLAISIWSVMRYLNIKIHPALESRRILFNLPSHLVRMSVVIQCSQIIIDTLILVLNAPLRRFPRIQSERIYTATICLLSLNIISVFQSGLATCYVKPMFYRNIQTLSELAATDKKIIVKYPAMMTDTFPANTSALYHTLNKRMFLMPNTSLTAYEIIYRMNMAGITRKITLKIQREDKFSHLIPECPRSYLLSYIVPKHWIFADTLNDIILNLLQAGIINKWIDDVNHRIQLESMGLQTSGSQHRPLHIDDLMLSIMILGVGFTFGSFLIVIELYAKKRTTQVLQYLP